MNQIQFTIDTEKGTVVPMEPRSKVVLLGATPAWRAAPLGDPEWEVWGLNRFWLQWGRYATRWFEIHPLTILRHEVGGSQIADLEQSHVPIYMGRVYRTIPMSVRYPIERVAAGRLKMFSSTFCYQMALAIHEGFKEIGIFGVNFSGGTARERLVEWRSLLYWFGLAEGLGIRLTFPEGQRPLEHRYLYGLDYWREVDDVRQQIKSFLAEKLVDGVKRGWRKKR